MSSDANKADKGKKDVKSNEEVLILFTPIGPLYLISKLIDSIKIQSSQTTKIEQIKDELQDRVLSNIYEVKSKLEEAYKNEKCELCKQRIKEALYYINEELEVVERTHRIFWAMEELKRKGLIPDVDWDELDEKDKKLVKKIAGYS